MMTTDPREQSFPQSTPDSDHRTETPQSESPSESHPSGVVYCWLPQRLTQGLVARRLPHADVETSGVPVARTTHFATNVPPLRHQSTAGFAFGDASSGAADFALATVHAILDQLGYQGPKQQVAGGTLVYTLAVELQDAFLARFIARAEGDELTIPWQKALAWMRQEMLLLTRQEGIALENAIARWREVTSGLPHEVPAGSLDRSEFLHVWRRDLVELVGLVSILDQFLGLTA